MLAFAREQARFKKLQQRASKLKMRVEVVQHPDHRLDECLAIGSNRIKNFESHLLRHYEAGTDASVWLYDCLAEVEAHLNGLESR